MSETKQWPLPRLVSAARFFQPFLDDDLPGTAGASSSGKGVDGKGAGEPSLSAKTSLLTQLSMVKRYILSYYYHDHYCYHYSFNYVL